MKILKYALFLIPAVSLAWYNDNPTNQSIASAQSDAAASAKSASKSTAGAVSVSSPTVTTTTTQNSAVSSESGGNTQNLVSMDHKPAVASAFAGVGDTTAKCRFHDGAGLQLFGGGFSFGKSRLDQDCQRIELAQMLYSKGQNVAATRVLCKIKTLQDALGDDCEALLTDQTPQTLVNAKQPVASNDPVTHEELNRVITKALQK